MLILVIAHSGNTFIPQIDEILPEQATAIDIMQPLGFEPRLLLPKGGTLTTVLDQDLPQIVLL